MAIAMAMAMAMVDLHPRGSTRGARICYYDYHAIGTIIIISWPSTSPHLDLTA